MSLASCAHKKQPAPPATHPTVASLVPAATDLIFGMNLGKQLVAVSTYDRGRPDIGKRPAVGDYQTVDWERLADLHPTCMIVEIAPDRLPAGFKQRAAELHIKLINVQIHRLADIFRAMSILGDALHAKTQATIAEQSLHAKLDAIAAIGKSHPPVSTLVALDATGTAVAGPGTYLDQLLHLAGGTNTADPTHSPWPTIDDETLHALQPQAVIVLMPGASKQQVAQAKANWARRTYVPAVNARTVRIITAWYALIPGWHVAKLAGQIAQCLQSVPTRSPAPSTQKSAGGALPG